MNKMHEDCEVAYLGVTVQELSRVFDAIANRNISVLPWTSPTPAFCRAGSDPLIDAFSDRIVSTHVSDTDLYLDRHLPVGDGKIDFKPVFQRLVDIGFSGDLEYRTAAQQ